MPVAASTMHRAEYTPISESPHRSGKNWIRRELARSRRGDSAAVRAPGVPDNGFEHTPLSCHRTPRGHRAHAATAPRASASCITAQRTPPNSRATATTAIWGRVRKANRRYNVCRRCWAFPGVGDHDRRLAPLARFERSTDLRRKAVRPHRLDQHVPAVGVARFGERAPPFALPRGVLPGDQPQIGHALPGDAKRCQSPISVVRTIATCRCTPRKHCSRLPPGAGVRASSAIRRSSSSRRESLYSSRPRYSIWSSAASGVCAAANWRSQWYGRCSSSSPPERRSRAGPRTRGCSAGS